MILSTADRRLLDALQVDATRSQVELAEIAGMSRTSCWRRIRDFDLLNKYGEGAIIGRILRFIIVSGELSIPKPNRNMTHCLRDSVQDGHGLVGLDGGTRS